MATVLGVLRTAPGILRLAPAWHAHLAPLKSAQVATAFGVPRLVSAWAAEPVITSAEPVTARPAGPVQSRDTASHEELPCAASLPWAATAWLLEPAGAAP